MDFSSRFLNPEVLVFCIPLLAIIIGGIIAIISIFNRHRERMRMIDQGIHPDYPPEEIEEENVRETEV